jgi:hypothetical protein
MKDALLHRCVLIGVPMAGNDPYPRTLVSCANIGSGKHSPSRMKPQLGQVSKHSPKPPKSESWAILHKREAGSYFANDAGHFPPEPGSFTFDSFSIGSACGADVLARESARNHINNASPRSSIKGSHIIPDREGRKASIILAGQKYIAGVGIELDGADGAPSEQFAAEYSATSAREKCQLIHGLPPNGCSVMILPPFDMKRLASMLGRHTRKIVAFSLLTGKRLSVTLLSTKWETPQKGGAR